VVKEIWFDKKNAPKRAPKCVLAVNEMYTG